MRTKRHLLRSVTNNGNPCKIYYFAMNNEDNPKFVVFMDKLVLTDNPEGYIKYMNVRWIYKRWGKTLLCYRDVIQLSSMETIFNVLNSEVNDPTTTTHS